MTEKQIDNLDALLHNMSNADLQAHINKTKFTKVICEPPEEEPEPDFVDIIQSMSVAELRAMADKSRVIHIDRDISELPKEEPEPDFVDVIQAMSASELRALFDKSKPINLNSIQEEALPKKQLKEKIAKTGLSKKVIKKIESNKQKATLEEIIAYCQGLKISFRDFLPELFSPLSEQ